jgi:6-phosphogluconolactonase
LKSPPPEVLIFPDSDALSRAGAEQFVQIGNEAVATRGRFVVALSGGSTPRRMYEKLASDDYRGRVDWSRVHFFWGDERAVPPDDPQSNFRMANQALLSRVPVLPQNIYRIPAEKAPGIAAAEYEKVLRDFSHNSLPRFDLVLLGLGTNAHTASLFPYTSVLRERTRWCAAVWVPELNTSRITLTVPVLNHGANVIFLVAGRDKAASLREVLRGPHDPERLPAQLIQPDEGKLVWLVDEEAAGGLK